MPEEPAAWRERWKGLGRQTLDLIYPPLCPGCGDPLDPEVFPALCRPCQMDLHPLDPPFCEVCGEKVHGVLPKAFSCWNCEGRDFSFTFARSGYHAHELVRDLIHRFKYGREMRLAPLLGQLLLRNWEDRRIERHDDWIMVPVPLHVRRERHRHFNQAAELCRIASRETGRPWIKALRRVRATPSQARLEKGERVRNLQGAFALKDCEKVRAAVEGARILLVDDVLTTGATGDECAKVLISAGKASMVCLITVARAGTPPLG